MEQEVANASREETPGLAVGQMTLENLSGADLPTRKLALIDLGQTATRSTWFCRRIVHRCWQYCSWQLPCRKAVVQAFSRHIPVRPFRGLQLLGLGVSVSRSTASNKRRVERNSYLLNDICTMFELGDEALASDSIQKFFSLVVFD